MERKREEMRALCSIRQLNCEDASRSSMISKVEWTPSSNVLGTPSSNIGVTTLYHVEETSLFMSDDVCTLTQVGPA